MAVTNTFGRNSMYRTGHGYSVWVARGTVNTTGAETNTDTVLLAAGNMQHLMLLSGRVLTRVSGTFATSHVHQLMWINDAPIAIANELWGSASVNAESFASPQIPDSLGTNPLAAEEAFDWPDATQINNVEVQLAGDPDLNTRIAWRITSVGAGTNVNLDYLISLKFLELGAYVPLS